MRRWTRSLSRAEWLRLSGFGGAILLLHLLGWGLFLYYSRTNPALAGLGTLAYTFGLRHAFDADHIAAIDNTTRKFLQEGKRSLGTGFFFSLGHSTIVFSLTTALAFAASAVKSSIPSFQHWGVYVGAGVSGTFLWVIGILNLLVLLDGDRGGAARYLGGRGKQAGAVPRRALAAAPVRGRNVADGHRRRRVHEPGLRLGVLESDPQGLLQHHRHEPLGHGRACDRNDRAAASALDEARAHERLLGLAQRSRLRHARLRDRRSLRARVGRVGRDLEGAPHRGAVGRVRE